MLSELTRRKETPTLFFIFVIPLFIFLVALALSGYSGLALIAAFSVLLIAFIASVLFLCLCDPRLTIRESGVLIINAILPKGKRGAMFIEIIDGRIYPNLSLANRAPKIYALHVRPGSAALIYREASGFEILVHGIHVFGHPVNLSGAFPTSPQHFILGPGGAQALQPRKRSESLADYHVRLSAAKKTRSESRDGQIIYPKFEVFFRVNLGGNNEPLLKIVRSFHKSCPEEYMDLVERLKAFLFVITLQEWNRMIADKTADQIYAEAPLRLFPHGKFVNGLACQIYISAMYRDPSEAIQ